MERLGAVSSAVNACAISRSAAVPLELSSAPLKI
jgi:hypothetical protein